MASHWTNTITQISCAIALGRIVLGLTLGLLFESRKVSTAAPIYSADTRNPFGNNNNYMLPVEH